jgi:hypothetical protein
MADLIHHMTVGGCSLEGQCMYVHFLFTWPTNEVLLTLISLNVSSPPSPLVIPDHSVAHFNHISATCKSILNNEEVIPIQVLLITTKQHNSIIC